MSRGKLLLVLAVACLLGAAFAPGTAVRAAGVGISYTVSDASADEGSAASPGVVTFTVTAQGAFLSGETVHYATADGTAHSGADYIATSGDLSFSAAGSQTVQVTLIGDATTEADEAFSLVLSNNPAISDGTGIGTVKNDDWQLSVADASVAEGDAGTRHAAVQITLSAPRATVTTVEYATSDVTATAGQDYTATAGTATIPANTPSAVVNVPVAGDTAPESDETFAFALSAPSSPVTIHDGGATVTITDDDDAPPPPLPKVSISNAQTAEGDDGTHSAVFTVSLSGATSETVTVQATTADGSATAPTDYEAKSAMIVFGPAAGPQTKQFGVDVVGDEIDEANETFTATLSAPSGATLDAAATTATMTIVDDDTAPAGATRQITTGAGAGSGAHVRVFDAAGAPREPEGFFPYPDGPGVRVARGDLDGDGHDELITAPGAGIPAIVRVFTPDGSAVVDQIDAYPGFNGGVFVAAGDVDGDGKAEVITSAGAGGGPHVRTFSLVGTPGNRSLVGAPGFFGARPDFTGGLTVAAGDVNDDGTDEIVLGVARGDQPIVSVWKYDPSSNTAALRGNPFLAYGAQFFGGVTVAAGDLDRDGKAEIVTGAGPGGGPHVRVFNGSGGGLPGSAYAYDAAFAGGVMVAVGDVDGNGANEIITGAGPGGGPHVRSFNVVMQPGATSFYAYAPTSGGGVFVAAGRP